MTTKNLHDKRLPNETAEYRAARDELLGEERSLREQVERVAALRRQLPAGGEIKEDYEFEEIDLTDGSSRPIRFSELFGDESDLLAYSYMFGPEWENPCPSCTSFIDGIDAVSRHIRQQAELVVIGKATPAQLYDIARERGWTDLRLLSCEKNDYASDYNVQVGDTSESLMPLMNVFQKDGDKIRHFWASSCCGRRWKADTPDISTSPGHFGGSWT